MGQETINLPVPLVDLFPTPGPESDTEKLDIKLDKSIGGGSNSNNPNDHPFGFYIMSGEYLTDLLQCYIFNSQHTRTAG